MGEDSADRESRALTVRQNLRAYVHSAILPSGERGYIVEGLNVRDYLNRRNRFPDMVAD